MGDRLVEYLVNQWLGLIICALLAAYWTNAAMSLVRSRRRTAQASGIVVAQPVRSSGFLIHNTRHRNHNCTLDIEYRDKSGRSHLLRSRVSDISDARYNDWKWPYAGIPHFAIGSTVLVDYDPDKPEDSSFSADNGNYIIGAVVLNLLVFLMSTLIVLPMITATVKCFSVEHQCSPPPKRR